MVARSFSHYWKCTRQGCWHTGKEIFSNWYAGSFTTSDRTHSYILKLELNDVKVFQHCRSSRRVSRRWLYRWRCVATLVWWQGRCSLNSSWMVIVTESVLISPADNGYTFKDPTRGQGLEPQGKEHGILSSRHHKVKDMAARTATLLTSHGRVRCQINTSGHSVLFAVHWSIKSGLKWFRKSSKTYDRFKTTILPLYGFVLKVVYIESDSLQRKHNGISLYVCP